MIEKISLDLIDDFNNHPFKVVEDESLKELADSINENGLLEPLVVRRKENGRYEMLSGHRRKKALELIGEKSDAVYTRKLEAVAEGGEYTSVDEGQVNWTDMLPEEEKLFENNGE